MFIDFLTVIMINLVAGSALLAYYLWRGIDEVDQRPYAGILRGWLYTCRSWWSRCSPIFLMVQK
jgi:hypothetical protein